jgi:subtilase family serine protease
MAGSFRRRVPLLALALGLAAAPAAALGAPATTAAPICPAPAPGTASCDGLVVTGPGGAAIGALVPAVLPSGLGPAQFHGAYNLPATTTKSHAQTIAIVDAFDDPTAEADLKVYDQTFGLPACTTANGCFTKVNQSGAAGPLPGYDQGWSLEISLDVQTAHEICQDCKILLVEADSNSYDDLGAAVDRAVAMGAKVVSNSYGGPEPDAVTAAHWTHPHRAIVASTGDHGFDGGFSVPGMDGFPATLNTTVAVGGTTLNIGSGNSYGSESAWSDGGSGCSANFTAKPWQKAIPDWFGTRCKRLRAAADVSADADPNTGAAIYDSNWWSPGWLQVGGTSLSAPLVAAVYGLAANAGSVKFPASLPYATSSGLRDVTTGSNSLSGCSPFGAIMCNAGPGFDGPTGLGTPNGLTAF